MSQRTSSACDWPNAKFRDPVDADFTFLAMTKEIVGDLPPGGDGTAVDDYSHVELTSVGQTTWCCLPTSLFGGEQEKKTTTPPPTSTAKILQQTGDVPPLQSIETPSLSSSDEMRSIPEAGEEAAVEEAENDEKSEVKATKFFSAEEAQEASKDVPSVPDSIEMVEERTIVSMLSGDEASILRQTAPTVKATAEAGGSPASSKKRAEGLPPLPPNKETPEAIQEAEDAESVSSQNDASPDAPSQVDESLLSAATEDFSDTAVEVIDTAEYTLVSVIEPAPVASTSEPSVEDGSKAKFDEDVVEDQGPRRPHRDVWWRRLG